ncbi:MAG: hypothetical protein ACFFDT_03815 [Candidatus Hodarchaeota archaeon]
MGREYEVRGLIATLPSLKRFIIIGIAITIVGIFLLLLNLQLIGTLLAWFGIMTSLISLISLLFLWLSNRILPQPK